jgi:hypothetical protein
MDICIIDARTLIYKLRAITALSDNGSLMLGPLERAFKFNSILCVQKV